MGVCVQRRANCLVGVLVSGGRNLPKPVSRADIEVGPNVSVIGIDPGGTTGWAVLCCPVNSLRGGSDPLAEIKHWSYGQLEGAENHQVDQLIMIIQDWEAAAIVCEGFHLRTLAAELSPVRITAALDWWLSYAKRPMFIQLPSMAKSTATDDRLKSWELYDKGNEHARDATRHASTFLRRTAKNAKLRAAAWPHIIWEVKGSSILQGGRATL